MDTNINIINIDSYLLIKHMYDALSIGMILTSLLDEPDLKKRDEFLVFSVMFIFYVYELE